MTGEVTPDRLSVSSEDIDLEPPGCAVLVVGCGSLLRGDDGVGPVLIRHLWDRGVPDGARLVDGGTAGMDVAFQMRGAGKVVIVDASATGATPGTVYRVRPRDGIDFGDGRSACHDVGFLRTLRDVAAAGDAPDVVVLGVEPQTIDWGLDLSPAVAASVPKVAEIVKRELGRNDRRT